MSNPSEPWPTTGHLNALDDSEEIPLGYVMKDPYGRRSFAFQRPSTGEIVSSTELNEARVDSPSMRNFFHRWDLVMCLSVSTDTGSPFLNSIIALLGTPVMILWLMYMNAISPLEMWWFGEGQYAPVASGEPDLDGTRRDMEKSQFEKRDVKCEGTRHESTEEDAGRQG